MISCQLVRLSKGIVNLKLFSGRFDKTVAVKTRKSRTDRSMWRVSKSISIVP